VKVNEILESLLVLYREKITAANVRLKKEFGDVPPITAFGGELRQVFSNLLTNAIDATPGGCVVICVRRAIDGSGRSGVRIVFADNGGGIPETVRPTIFEPFVSTKGARGTGLGLWVTSEIVQKHGGVIRVKSSSRSERHGTVFSVFLPEATGTTEYAAA
jgi:signal transduction histidine kinase